MNKSYFCPLSLELIQRNENCNFTYGETEHLPVHDSVIQPLLSQAKEALVYCGSEPRKTFGGNWIMPLDFKMFPFLTSARGKYLMDVGQDCIHGYEQLWNVTSWRRGSIVIVLSKAADLREIFPFCYRPALTETPNSGNSPAAIQRCKKAMAEDDIAILFSASNGIERCQIYTSEDLFSHLYRQAKALCQEADYWDTR